MADLTYLQIRNPKDDETPIESGSQIFASLLSVPYVPLWKRGWIKPKSFAFELYLLSQTVYFYVSGPKESEQLIASLVSSSFPTSTITLTGDPMESFFSAPYIEAGEMTLSSTFYFPIKTFMDFKDVDPLSALIGFLSKQNTNIKLAVQILVGPASFPWQNRIAAASASSKYDQAADKYMVNPHKKLMEQKASYQGGKVCIRLLAASDSPDTTMYLRNLAGTFGSFSLGEGNQFLFKRRLLLKDQLLRRIRERKMLYRERRFQILNSQELATIWHPPGILLGGIRNIAWGKTLLGEPPENLPVVSNVPEEEKKDVNFFAKTTFKNQEQIFGIKSPDRRKHVYIIGKTGAGKSTLIENMAIDDIRKGRGIGVIDPHGDLTENILNYVPNRRVNDVVYLEPFDTSRPFSINMMEVKNQEQRDLVASGIVSIFYKLYGDSWGPRLEYILRNVILTLLETPGATLADMLRLLSDQRYRERVVDKLQDQVIKNFWVAEFAHMPDKMKAEVVSPIQNKVGQFVTSRMIRPIVGSSKSTVNLEDIMDSGKILLLNLSQGKLGEDNAALLGAMMITKIQLAAMNRAFKQEHERRDFFLYVDEFQNFATNSFIKILSEARKYHLALTLANQYIDQLEEPVAKAIFGNVGTIASFVVGASDAEMLMKEFSELYTQNDLVALGKYEIVTKLCIDNFTSMPFPAKTLPPPSLTNDNKDKIIRLSKEKYGRNAQELTTAYNDREEREASPRPQQASRQPEFRKDSGNKPQGGAHQAPQKPTNPQGQKPAL